MARLELAKAINFRLSSCGRIGGRWIVEPGGVPGISAIARAT